MGIVWRDPNVQTPFRDQEYECYLIEPNSGGKRERAIRASSPTEAAEFLCRELWTDGGDEWVGFEDQVSVTVYVDDKPYCVTPIMDFKFDAEVDEDD